MQTLTKSYINPDPKPNLNKPYTIFETNPNETLIHTKQTPKKP